VLSELRQCFEKERQYGHEVSVALIQDFYVKFLEKAVVTAKLKLTSTMAPPPALETQYKLLQQRLQIMNKTDQASEKFFQRRVLPQIGAVLRKPQRLTRLTAAQENMRVQLTWQSLDRGIYEAAYGDDEQLASHCKDVQQWRANLPGTVIAMWDHVPVWLKLRGDSKVCFTSQEQTTWQARKRLSRKTRQAVAEAERTNASARAASEDAEAMAVGQGQTQARGSYSSGGDKYRVTQILFQSVSHWLDASQAPTGHACVHDQSGQLPPLESVLIAHGSSHCRQSPARIKDVYTCYKYILTYTYVV
jgi:hypothetical protein